MFIRQIRNATLIIEYAGKKFLVDPMLSAKGTYPGFPGTANDHLANPLVDLPAPAEQLLDVDAVIVTHMHLDHWDDLAKEIIPKDILMFVQNEEDAVEIQKSGFTNLRVLSEDTHFDGICMTKTSGQHGSDEALDKLGARLGHVCGIVFSHQNEKTLYLAGDTVWNQYVVSNLETYKPDVVIVNCGDAQIPGLGSIIMNASDVEQVCRKVPQATVIASHMEAVNHCMLSRKELREFLIEKGLEKQVLVPDDGETCQI
ncbi:MBL fold metallo-hydrolase [Microvirga sp. W0021]|uniref:MBL fold metallo-hydrolase n=1 Tax=Hohaiivirga grylli TaxID=3133970 RepID=A0ABV0BGL5_9HYPH